MGSDLNHHSKSITETHQRHLIKIWVSNASKEVLLIFKCFDNYIWVILGLT